MKPAPVLPGPDESFETATPAPAGAFGAGKNGEYVPPADESDMEPLPPPAVPPQDAMARLKAPIRDAALRPVLQAQLKSAGGAGRTLPHSLEAEEQLLSACLFEEEDVLSKCIEGKIRPNSFYDSKHGIVFETLLAMRAASIPISAATLAQELTTARKLDSVGGYSFITQISSAAPTTVQANYFIQTVREQATLREIIRAATSAVEDCYGFSGDLPELTSDLTRRLTFAVEGRVFKDDWPQPSLVSVLCENPPPIPEQLIDGVLYYPGTFLLSGPSKTHKTFTCLDLAIAIATGGKWFGRQCFKAPCLYLNLELQDFAVTDRIAKICAARGVQPPDNLHIWNLRGKAVSMTELQSRLPAMIKKTGAKAVLIDPHYKISSVSGMEESSNDDQGKLLSVMEGLCHNACAALILTHHFAKGDASAKNAQDRASGAGTFTRWPDVFVTFTPHDEDDAMTIDFFLRNFAPIESFVVRWEYPRWQTDNSLDPKDLKRNNGGKFSEKHSSAELLETLGDNVYSSPEWERASGLSHGTFVRKRQELMDKGLVSLASGCYRKR